jgi:hypothetical protein
LCEVQEVTRSALRPVQQGRRIENLCEVQEVIELWEVCTGREAPCAAKKENRKRNEEVTSVRSGTKRRRGGLV